jgi:hypothetical protein
MLFSLASLVVLSGRTGRKVQSCAHHCLEMTELLDVYPQHYFLTEVIITSVLLEMMRFTILVPFLAIYSFNLENYEQEKSRC